MYNKLTSAEWGGCLSWLKFCLTVTSTWVWIPSDTHAQCHCWGDQRQAGPGACWISKLQTLGRTRKGTLHLCPLHTCAHMCTRVPRNTPMCQSLLKPWTSFRLPFSCYCFSGNLCRNAPTSVISKLVICTGSFPTFVCPHTFYTVTRLLCLRTTCGFVTVLHSEIHPTISMFLTVHQGSALCILVSGWKTPLVARLLLGSYFEVYTPRLIFTWVWGSSSEGWQ